jgi:hypothetical protein
MRSATLTSLGVFNSKKDGGLELQQKIEGHAPIVLTMDRYEHLFPEVRSLEHRDREGHTPKSANAELPSQSNSNSSAPENAGLNS